MVHMEVPLAKTNRGSPGHSQNTHRVFHEGETGAGWSQLTFSIKLRIHFPLPVLPAWANHMTPGWVAGPWEMADTGPLTRLWPALEGDEYRGKSAIIESHFSPTESKVKLKITCITPSFMSNRSQ